MQKEWSSFRITLILYLVVLALPFSFYFVYSSFKTMQHDTQIVRQSSWVTGAIEHLAVDPANQNNPQMIERVDKTLHKISLWVTQNNASDLYIGAQTLSKDFSQVESCWTSYKKNLLQHNTAQIKQQNLQCYALADNMAIIVEKMVYLKQNKIINIFYLSLAIATIFSLLMIYLIRTYIHIQMKKHAIHDHDTKLFNKKYFLSQLETSCARSVRYKYPLSILSISIDDFGKESEIYDKKTRTHILKMLGGLIISLTRTSDIASRYDENHFLILLPDTEEENALILERRIRETLEEHDFMVESKLKFNFSTTHFNHEETPAGCIARAEALLKNT